VVPVSQAYISAVPTSRLLKKYRVWP
jgi:hypothetical protein